MNFTTNTFTFQVTEQQLFSHMLVSNARHYWELFFKHSQFGATVLKNIVNLELTQNILKTTNAIPTIQGIVSNTFFQLKMEIEQEQCALLDMQWDPADVHLGEEGNLNTIDQLLMSNAAEVSYFFASLVSNIIHLINATFPYRVYCDGILAVTSLGALTLYLRG